MELRVVKIETAVLRLSASEELSVVTYPLLAWGECVDLVPEASSEME
jgi:hypothetical protein